jgi:hypothetical protein
MAMTPMPDDATDPLRRRLAERLGGLRREYAAGEQHLATLEQRAAELRETMLRISGAMQVLEELLAEKPEPAPARAAQSAA